MSTVIVAPQVGTNAPNSVADLDVPFPAEWLRLLREESPVTEAHAWLLPYWYRAGARWVLYQCWPVALIPKDALLVPGFSTQDFFAAVDGPPPYRLEPWQRTPYLSDLQYELYRRHQVYARPCWVLEGTVGGHPVVYEPWQQNLMAAKGLPTAPPPIGSLDPCPFDNRAVHQLRQSNRLLRLKGSVAKLRASGSAEGADQQLDAILREIRHAELAIMQDQLDPMLDVAKSVSRRSDARDHLVYTDPGSAGHAADALDHYLDTGDFTY